MKLTPSLCVRCKKHYVPSPDYFVSGGVCDSCHEEISLSLFESSEVLETRHRSKLRSMVK